MLNEAQMQAVMSDEPRILCLAGAGTGKTHCMLERIARLIRDGVNPKSILALTFTNAAAFEMRDRYTNKKITAATPEFRTFHSFCYNLLASDKAIRAEIGYSDCPKIADDVAEKRIEKHAIMQTGIKPVSTKAKSSGKLSPYDSYRIAMLDKAKLRLMRAENLITFDTLCQSVCDLFVNKHSTVASYLSRYKYIFVDEFQDTDPIQFKFITSFENANLFVVGDALQAIYSFRGADSSIIKQLSESEDWTTIKLHENYRSSSKICNYANKLGQQYAGDSYRVALDSTRPGTDVLTYYYTHNSYPEIIPSDIVNNILDDIESNDDNNAAILVRTNREVAELKDKLDELHVPYFTKEQDTHRIHAIKAALDERYAVDWLASALSADEYTYYIKLAALRNPYSLHQFLSDFSENLEIQERKKLIDSINEIRHSTASIPEKRKQLSDLLEGNDDSEESNLFIESVPETADIDEVLSAVVDSDNRSDTSLTRTGTYVGTIHSVKGLEYDAVYVIGVDTSMFKLTSEENYNLFYVAVTRAKHRLIIYRKETES